MQCIDEVRTERLILNRISSLDVENLTALYGDPEVMAQLSGIRAVEQTESMVDWFVQHWAKHGFGPWMAREAISNRFVGILGLLQERIEGTAEVHIGFVLMRQFWGRGLATEAAHAIAHIAFSVLDLPSLESYTTPVNTSARRVMEKAGFSFERNFTNEEGVPQVLYRRTKATWRKSIGTVPEIPLSNWCTFFESQPQFLS